MSTKGSKLQETLQRPAEEEEIIEPKEYVVRYTHDVVASSFLSFQADCIQNPSSTLVKMGQKVFEASWSNIIKTGFSFFVPTLANALRVSKYIQT